MASQAAAAAPCILGSSQQCYLLGATAAVPRNRFFGVLARGVSGVPQWHWAAGGCYLSDAMRVESVMWNLMGQRGMTRRLASLVQGSLAGEGTGMVTMAVNPSK